MTEYSKKEIQQQLLEQLSSVVQEQDANKFIHMNLYELNVDSLCIMRILSNWMKLGYKVRFADFMKNPYVDSWADILVKAQRKKVTISNDEEVSDKEPFALTDVQYAYWMGRKESQYLGGVGCHGYMEVRCQKIDETRLEEAFNMLKQHHSMLRACYTEDGKQYILEKSYSDSIEIEDISKLSQSEKKMRLACKREELSHRLLHIDQGQVVDLKLTKLDDNNYVMHFDIDLLICDVLSFKIILRDLAAYYTNGILPPAKKDWNFANYLSDKKKALKTTYNEDKIYWESKLSSMPMGPDIPTKKGIDKIKYPRFKRHHMQFDRAEWGQLKKQAVKYKLTPAMLLLTAYARTIGKWSENKKFLLNLPLFNRDNNEDVENVVADFTNIVLVEIDMCENRSFFEDAKRIQERFLENASHSAYSGIQVLRDLQKSRTEDVKAPVVFSCNLGEPLLSKEFVDSFGELQYMISQTPQVWIDFQAFDEKEGLYVLWDCIDEIFPDGLLDEMFDYFIHELRELVNGNIGQKKLLYSKGEKERNVLWNTVKKAIVPTENLHEKIFEYAYKTPDKVAIRNGDNDVEVTYAELAKKALSIAAGIDKRKKHGLVALFLPRGEKQIIAAMGVLSAGMGYIPIQITQPKDRLEYMLRSEDITCIITEEEYVEKLPEFSGVIKYYRNLIKGTALVEPVKVGGESIAYVIFTSGTTGVPKGVKVSHQAAMNTILEVNRLANITSEDIIFNVSSYDFDLSVYDFFGILREGGTVIVINQDSWRNAKKWCEIVRKNQVTIWNSVPTLFKMLLVETNGYKDILSSMRYIYLSGDWIDMDIPSKIYQLNASVKLLAMGGATEAAIWSNYILVQGEVDKEWISIPYGKPLTGQFYRIVDDYGRDCPCYVKGELWIGGIGVASGYLYDEELTQKKFITDENGDRWYKTGDLGRFWADGTIEFLGRADRQVKLRGHRIELGEIENVLDTMDVVEKSCVDITRGTDTQALTAYIKLDASGKSEYIENQVTDISLRQEKLVESYFDKENEKELQALYQYYDRYTAGILKQWLERAAHMDVSSAYKPLLKYWRECVTNLDEGREKDISVSLEKYIKVFDNRLQEILEGKIGAGDLVLDKDFEEVSSIVSESKEGILFHNLLKSRLRALQIEKKNIRVLEIGCNNVKYSREYREILDTDDYTVVFESNYYKDKFGDDTIKTRIMHLDEMLYKQEDGYDLIIANQSLHRTKNVNITLENLKKNLKKDGLLVFTEPTTMTSLAWISTVFLRKEYDDHRKNTFEMLLNHNQWKTAITECGLEILNEVTDDGRCGGISCFLIKNNEPHSFVREYLWLKEYLKSKLPEYMIPKYFVIMWEFPITKNGKIDRKMLQSIMPDISKDRKQIQAFTDKTQIKLAEIWSDILQVKVMPSDNYFMLGGDSLLATSLRNKIREVFHVDISLEIIYKAPVLVNMAKEIDTLKGKENVEIQELHKVVDNYPYAPFPLTSMQQSYLIGRSGGFELGDVSSHCYFEMNTTSLEVKRIENAFNKLIELHPMMRAVVCEDNLNQRILEKVEHYKIAYEDLSKFEEPLIQERLLSEREELAHQSFDPYKWPSYEIRYKKISNKEGRLLLSFDNLFFDGWSMFYIFRQWKQLYKDLNAQIEPADMTFKEYVLSCNENKKQMELDYQYWKERIKDIYPAPEFNVNRNSEKGSFVRFQTKLNYEQWIKLKSIIKSYGLTEPAFLMSVYAEVISAYSRSGKFSLNLTRFNRIPFTKKVNDIVGDFTTLTILSLDRTIGQNFLERTKELQERLWMDLSHSSVNGVDVERMLNKNKTSTITMPVVFTSGIGLTEDRTIEDNSYLGDLGYGLSQTPQVWMDMQAYDDKNGLVVSIDAVENLFPDGMLNEMFDSYASLLHKFIDNDQIWKQDCGNLVESKNKELIYQLNNTDVLWEERNLLTGFIENAKEHSDAIAIVNGSYRYSYGEVYEKAAALAKTLLDRGYESQTPVGIMIKKGAQQIIAAVGILMARGIYLPLNPEHPVSRNGRIMEDSGMKFLICDSSNDSYNRYKEYATCIMFEELLQEEFEPLQIQKSDIAYIIYTSGTTGMPKGVAITHEGAINTILDVNRIIRAQPTDATIALSQMNFDLSVYDIFGMFDVGGKIVVPEEKYAIEPSYWYEIIQKEKVTIWNTVPSYFQMYISYLEEFRKENQSVKTILLSGDWIPVDTRERGKHYFINAIFYALGGATEASIWSNIHEIRQEDQFKSSIPYGIPLANQKMYILNENLDVVQNNVVGDLYIAGKGLAVGYWKDEARTADSYFIHPKFGERLYKTGDLAMYSPDGYIIFLGREDGQVKLNGYRIEIGEIENAIKRVTSGAVNAVVMKNNQLHAFVEGHINKREEIKADLSRELPNYMIPRSIHCVEKMPLNVNGKIDRKHLESICMDRDANCEEKIMPSTEWEKQIADVWKKCLEVDKVYVNDNFFQLGGDSLKAVWVVNEIKKIFHIEIPLGTLFDCATVKGLAGYLSEIDSGYEEGDI